MILVIISVILAINTMVRFSIGDQVFNLQYIVVMENDGYLRTLILEQEEKLIEDTTQEELVSITFQINRDPACFPLIVKFYQGYSLKKSMINALCPKELTLEDFYEQVYEDAKFYDISLFSKQVIDMISVEQPILAKKLNICICSKSSITDMRKELPNIIEELTDAGDEVVVDVTKISDPDLTMTYNEMVKRLDFIRFSLTAKISLVYMLEYILNFGKTTGYIPNEINASKVANKLYMKLSEDQNLMYELHEQYNKAISYKLLRQVGCLVYKLVLS